MKDFTLNLDYWELLNLHKALLEAKFHDNPDNELVSGSPLIADVYIQVRDLLIQSGRQSGWEAFFQLKNRSDYKKRAMTRMANDSRWEKSSDDEKRKIAGDYLAPFLYDEGELTEVVTETEFLFREQAISQLPHA